MAVENGWMVDPQTGQLVRAVRENGTVRPLNAAPASAGPQETGWTVGPDGQLVRAVRQNGTVSPVGGAPARAWPGAAAAPDDSISAARQGLGIVRTGTGLATLADRSGLFGDAGQFSDILGWAGPLLGLASAGVNFAQGNVPGGAASLAGTGASLGAGAAWGGAAAGPVGLVASLAANALFPHLLGPGVNTSHQAREAQHARSLGDYYTRIVSPALAGSDDPDSYLGTLAALDRDPRVQVMFGDRPWSSYNLSDPQDRQHIESAYNSGTRFRVQFEGPAQVDDPTRRQRLEDLYTNALNQQTALLHARYLGNPQAEQTIAARADAAQRYLDQQAQAAYEAGYGQMAQIPNAERSAPIREPYFGAEGDANRGFEAYPLFRDYASRVADELARGQQGGSDYMMELGYRPGTGAEGAGSWIYTGGAGGG